MTDKIIALVDGSIYSESVCAHAAWIATRTGAPVELIHILGRRDAPETTDLSGSIRLGARSKLLEELAELDAQRAKLVGHRGRAILDDARAIVEEAGATGCHDAPAPGRCGGNDQRIEGEAAGHGDRQARRGGGFREGPSGLEPGADRAHGQTAGLRRFAGVFTDKAGCLVAYDGSRLAMKAVDQISRSPLFSGLGVTVVTVGADTSTARKGLDDAKALLRAAGIAAETRLMEGRPDEVLSGLIGGEDFGLLVMGAFGHSRIRSFVIGSTTTEMVRSCQVPVLMVH
jgi:nucleotide-binding universal stress UspA family protein